MCLVGEGFEESSDEVCGAVVQIRPKADKIAIWTANSKKDQDILTIGYAEVGVRGGGMLLNLQVQDVEVSHFVHQKCWDRGPAIHHFILAPPPPPPPPELDLWLKR